MNKIKAIIMAALLLLVVIFALRIIENNFMNSECPISKGDITWQNGRAVYVGKNSQESMFGIDVSSHNGKIDWKSVKKQGVKFVMIRIGYRGFDEGNIMLDKTFYRNITGAKKAGLKVGGYFFTQAINEEEAKKEADFVCSVMKPFKPEMPIAFDMEAITGEITRTDALTNEDRNNIALAFCNKVEERGFNSMIYGNKKWMKYKYDQEKISEKEIWLANYAKFPNFPYKFRMWQFTERGKIAGISGFVDMNLWLPEL